MNGKCMATSRMISNVLIRTYAVLQHPFTCILAGCTQSCKTVWVKTLLENAQKTISPPLQRIIWFYGQWQPSYFDMMKTMPGIEFYQDISEDVDDVQNIFHQGKEIRNISLNAHYIVLFKSPRDRHRDYFMVGECVRFLFTSCEGSLNERVSAANE